MCIITINILRWRCARMAQGVRVSPNGKTHRCESQKRIAEQISLFRIISWCSFIIPASASQWQCIYLHALNARFALKRSRQSLIRTRSLCIDHKDENNHLRVQFAQLIWSHWDSVSWQTVRQLQVSRLQNRAQTNSRFFVDSYGDFNRKKLSVR